MNAQGRSAAVVLALVLLAALATPVLAASGGNSGPSAACANGGYLNYTDTAGNPFRNEGACTSYAAHGGTLVPVVQGPFSVTYTDAGGGVYNSVITGTGLEPLSHVRFAYVWPERSVIVDFDIDASGTVVFSHGESCYDINGNHQTSLTATGTPAGGSETDYPLALPPTSICP